MKRYILSLLTAAAAFISCSDELALTPAVSFFAETPEVTDDTAIFRLAAAFITDSTEMIIPVSFGGSAERDADYTASADAFVLGGDSPIDSIVVTTLKFGTEKNVTLSVDLPEGIDAGRYLTSGFTIQDHPAYLSFDSDFGILTDTATVSFSVTDKAGKKKALPYDIEISVITDTEKSTAAEGADFSFADSTHFTIKAGETKGALKITRPDSYPAEGRNAAFFRLSHDERYGEGAFTEKEYQLMDAGWKDLDGSWRMAEVATDSTFMAGYWGDTYSGLDMLPESNGFDIMLFDMNDGVLKTFLSSQLKYYFLDDSYLRSGPFVELTDIYGTSSRIQSFLIGNTNRYFSKDESSEDKESYIGIRFLEGPESISDTLDLYIFDHTSRSFMPELEAEGKYAPEKPVAASPGLYLNVKFTKDQ